MTFTSMLFDDDSHRTLTFAEFMIDFDVRTFYSNEKIYIHLTSTGAQCGYSLFSRVNWCVAKFKCFSFFGIFSTNHILQCRRVNVVHLSVLIAN